MRHINDACTIHHMTTMSYTPQQREAILAQRQRADRAASNIWVSITSPNSIGFIILWVAALTAPWFGLIWAWYLIRRERALGNEVPAHLRGAFRVCAVFTALYAIVAVAFLTFITVAVYA